MILVAGVFEQQLKYIFSISDSSEFVVQLAAPPGYELMEQRKTHSGQLIEEASETDRLMSYSSSLDVHF
ncbi:uncharacterized protein PGTG_22454 [Puccinia graminis f. sp. tritici CRL 75-36-700-3]|uniref:Uncharacterized protein n=1 Tax=Puccinia graminis f. sp. tritici (strain CRL 75-36-700-3 / race SCCL) TaxID=418459 RepID=H6QUL7_PUCGT|nr:uncharacterized protein PGTG_22454 [Puccinia graminis f. sp. tritici CRL 75-36-700-3]EHS64729.1 hypothetical protein PGTG_22454 [Puccinia graminis f. sp. tritici CRL 75-36-700-3]